MKLARTILATGIIGALWVGSVALLIGALWIFSTTNWPEWVLSAVGIAGFGYLAWKADKLRVRMQDEEMTRKIKEEDIYGAPEWPER